MSGSLRSPVETLADELAVRHLAEHYADAATRLDPKDLASLFTEDGVWDADVFGRHAGRDALEPFFGRMLSGWNAFVQVIPSGRVFLDEADADRARGRWYVHEVGQRSNGTNFDVVGVYHDEYVREDGAWRIASRRYDSLVAKQDGEVTALPFPANAPKLG